MDLTKTYNIWASLAVWGAVLMLVRRERIIRLLPVGVYGLAWLLTVESFARSFGNYRFVKGLVMIAGFPLFHLIFGLGAAILLAHFIGIQHNFGAKFLVVFIFASLDQLLFFGAVAVGMIAREPEFTLVQKMYRDILVLSFYAYTAEGWFGDRINQEYELKH